MLCHKNHHVDYLDEKGLNLSSAYISERSLKHINLRYCTSNLPLLSLSIHVLDY